MLVLFKIPAYFGDGNKTRRATQSPPFQGRSFPRKAKSCCCVSFPPCPQARSILPEKSRAMWRRHSIQNHEGAGVGRDSTGSQSLSAQKKDRNWQNAEARQSSKPTCRKKSLQTQATAKGDGFYFTEYQNKSGSPMETANPELTSMPQIPHSIATDLGKSWQEGGAHRKRQEKQRPADGLLVSMGKGLSQEACENEALT